MTRKDFELIAKAIRESTTNKDKRLFMAEVFASFLSNTNPRFNKDRFLRACEEGK